LINTHWKTGWPGHTILNIFGSIFGQSPVRGKHQNLKFRWSSVIFYRAIQLLINTHWKIGWPGHTILNICGSIFGQSPVRGNIRIENFARVLPFYSTIQLLLNIHWKIGWPGHTILTILGSILGQSPVRGNIQKLKFRGSSAFLQDNLTVDKCTLEDRLARTHNSVFFVSGILGPWVRSNARISKPPACQPAPLPRRSGQRPPGSAAALSHRLCLRRRVERPCGSPASLLSYSSKLPLFQSILGIVYYSVIDIPWGGHRTAKRPMW